MCATALINTIKIYKVISQCVYNAIKNAQSVFRTTLVHNVQTKMAATTETQAICANVMWGTINHKQTILACNVDCIANSV